MSDKKSIWYVCPGCGHKVLLPVDEYYCTACMPHGFNTKHIDRQKMMVKFGEVE